MADQDGLLNELDTLLKDSFKDTIVWDQKGESLFGKYLYVKYEKVKIGLFIGYVLEQDSRIKACVTFIFPHPLSTFTDESAGSRRLFYKILIRCNLKLKVNPYKIVNGRKSPAMIRTLFFKDENSFSINRSLQFFMESISPMKLNQPVYKVVA